MDMNKFTDEQLKVALAKMLPNQLQACFTSEGMILRHKEGKWLTTDVRRTELLHLCHQVEKTLTAPKECVDYLEWLGMCEDDYGYKNFMLVNASWQEKVVALAHTKSVEIV